MFRRSLSVPAALVAAALVMASVPVAHASGPEVDASSEDPDALSAAAVEAFHNKEYDAAISLFERAYEIDPQPNYKFNIGRVYEEKGDLEKAVQYYQEFVKSPGVDLEARKNASTRLEVLRQTLAALEEKKEEAAAQKRVEDEPEPSVEPEPSATTSPVDDGVEDRKHKLRIAGYTLLGVGGAGLIVGSVFGGLALAKSRDAEDATLVDDKIDLRRQAKTRANVADALLVTGGVLAGVGLVLVLSTLGKRKRDARSAVAPSFGPRGVGLAWTARF